VIEKLQEVFMNFLDQEAGNRVSQYNMQGFLNIVTLAVSSIGEPGQSVEPDEDTVTGGPDSAE